MSKPDQDLTAESVVEALRTRARVGLCLVDADLRYMWVNDAFARLIGYSTDELVGRSVSEITYPDDIEIDRRLSARAFGGEIPHFTTRKRYLHKDGSIVTVDLMASVMHDDDGDPLGGFATVVPVAAWRLRCRSRPRTTIRPCLPSAAAWSTS